MRGGVTLMIVPYPDEYAPEYKQIKCATGFDDVTIAYIFTPKANVRS